MVVVMMNVRKVRIYKTILLNLVQVRVQSRMDVATLRLLILHSFILTLITLVSFFVFIVLVRLGVLDRKAIFLALASYFLLFIKFFTFHWVLISFFVLFRCSVDMLRPIKLLRFGLWLVLTIRNSVIFRYVPSFKLSRFEMWIHDRCLVILFQRIFVV